MRKLVVLGLAHGINDCVAGFILGSLLHMGMSNTAIGIAVLLYNILAFAGQIVVPQVIEKMPGTKSWLIACMFLLPLAMLLLPVNSTIAIVLVGVASAVIHVVGGYEAVQTKNQSIGLGLFASPGVVGLAIGGYLAWQNVQFIAWSAAVCAVMLVLIMVSSFHADQKRERTHEDNRNFDQHDLLMLIMLTVISLRSVVWNIFQFVSENDVQALLIIGTVAFAGKLCGGFLSNRFGEQRYAIAALTVSLPFVTILKNNFMALCAGIFFLQSTFPATAQLLIAHSRRNAYTGVAYAFGLSIVIGGMAFFTPLKTFMNSDVVVLSITCISIALLFSYSQKLKKMASGRGHLANEQP